MQKKVRIEYTETFFSVTDNLINYLAPHSSEAAVIGKIEDFIEFFESKVSESPYSCQISPTLQTLGITYFREFYGDGLRLIYRTLETETEVIIQGDLLLSQKQDIQQALIDYCLIYK